MLPLGLQATQCPLPHLAVGLAEQFSAVRSVFNTPHFPSAVHATVLETLCHSGPQGTELKGVFESQSLSPITLSYPVCLDFE